MNDLRELYQEVILDHNRQPRNFHRLEDSNRDAEGHNPLCGDQVHVYLKVGSDGIVQDVSFEGSGCAISTASASIMTESVKGKSVEEVQKLFHLFHSLVTGKPVSASEEELGKLAVFHGVSEFPVRVKCATLAWHTLQAALQKTSTAVTTE